MATARFAPKRNIHLAAFPGLLASCADTRADVLWDALLRK